MRLLLASTTPPTACEPKRSASGPAQDVDRLDRQRINRYAVVLAEIRDIARTNAVLLDAHAEVRKSAQDRPGRARRETGGGGARCCEKQVAEAVAGALLNLPAVDGPKRRVGRRRSAGRRGPRGWRGRGGDRGSCWRRCGCWSGSGRSLRRLCAGRRAARRRRGHGDGGKRGLTWFSASGSEWVSVWATVPGSVMAREPSVGDGAGAGDGVGLGAGEGAGAGVGDGAGAVLVKELAMVRVQAGLVREFVTTLRPQGSRRSSAPNCSEESSSVTDQHLHPPHLSGNDCPMTGPPKSCDADGIAIRRAVVDATTGAGDVRRWEERALEKRRRTMSSTSRRRRAPGRSKRMRSAAAGTAPRSSTSIPPVGSTRRSRNDRGCGSWDPAGPSGKSPVDGTDAAITARADPGVAWSRCTWPNVSASWIASAASASHDPDFLRNRNQRMALSLDEVCPAAGTCRRSQTSNNVTLGQSAETRLRSRCCAKPTVAKVKCGSSQAQ